MLLSGSLPSVISSSLCFYLLWVIASVNAIPLSPNPLSSATHDSSRSKLPQSLSLYLFTCNGQAVSLASGKNLAFGNKGGGAFCWTLNKELVRIDPVYVLRMSMRSLNFCSQLKAS
ncbi:hypothetical protein F5879DRAFT_589146 [Lentinula edodes]|nr:hypothetical protein F5879DRAFT_589146 [Lentinula edodes]